MSQVVELVNRYKSSGAQMTVKGDPFVSTFEGPDWADNWAAVRSETGGLFLVPDWSSIGPYGVAEKLDMIDGACEQFFPSFWYWLSFLRITVSWDAWPKAGCSNVTSDEDKIYQEILRGKKYMMPVSPCFYTSTHISQRITRRQIHVDKSHWYAIQTYQCGIRIGIALASLSGMTAGIRSWMLCRIMSRS